MDLAEGRCIARNSVSERESENVMKRRNTWTDRANAAWTNAWGNPAFAYPHPSRPRLSRIKLWLDKRYARVPFTHFWEETKPCDA